MDDSTVGRLRQLVESEEKAGELNPIPDDTYVKLASYCQRLRAGAGTGNENDIANRLARKQLWLVEAMTKNLLELRLKKAEKLEQDGASGRLLPEEGDVGNTLTEFEKKESRFVRAVVDGQPSFFTLVRRREMQRMVTVRFSKPVSEVIGPDLRRYGPFAPTDVARVPLGNARAMMASGDAVLVSTSDS